MKYLACDYCDEAVFYLRPEAEHALQRGALIRRKDWLMPDGSDVKPGFSLNCKCGGRTKFIPSALRGES